MENHSFQLMSQNHFGLIAVIYSYDFMYHQQAKSYLLYVTHHIFFF